MSTQADLQARDVGFDGPRSRFRVHHHGKEQGEILLNLPGIHNVNNALAAIAVGIELDIPFSRIKTALEELEGVQRPQSLRQRVSLRWTDRCRRHLYL